MIELQKYIKNFRYIHPSFRGANGYIISDFIKQNEDLSSITEVCTTEVYPQCLKIGQEEFLVWDHTFWMLYRRFLFGIWRFTPKKTSLESLSTFLLSLQYLFLSLRFTKLPALSYYFAQEYYRLNDIIPSFQYITNTKFEENLLGKQLFKQLDDFAQWQVFFHELRHFSYRYDNNLFVHHLKIIQSIFDFYDKRLHELSNYKEMNYDHFLDTINYYAKVKNISELEEICCDVFAIVDFYNMYLKKLYQQNKEEIVLGCFSTIRYVLEMQMIFTVTERVWKPIADIVTYEKGNSDFRSNIDKTFHIINSRNGLVYAIAAYILNVDFNSVTIANELFDSEYYLAALKSSIMFPYTDNNLEHIYSYIDVVSKKFLPSQLQSARDLLIGWF